MPGFLRWSRFGLRTKGLIVVGLPVLPLAVFWLITVVAVVRQADPANTTSRSLTVQASLARVLSDLLDADAGARNHLLTDSSRALKRYAAAVERLPADMAVLDNAVIDPDLRASLTDLQALVNDELMTVARIAGQPLEGAPAMGEVEALGRSADNLDRLRALSTTMQKGQAALADAQTARDERSRRLFFYGFLAGSVICVGAGVVAALLLAGGVSRRAAVVARNADRLAHGERLEPLPAGEDELGLVDARLREAARLLRRRERELRDRTADLEAANHDLEAFSYSVSHDLRAPLRAIDGFSEALEQDYGQQLDAEAKDALRRVRAAAGRMATLIDEMLKLSRLSQIEPRREPVDLGESADAIIGELARRCPARDVDVQVEPGLVARADPELVRIALHNLLDNAWKYTGKTERPRIQIGSTPNGHARVFHVRDNGAGFDMAYAHKLFGPFQRLHADRDFEGTGIGLAIVHRIVSKHGGRIWAESAVNAGATFYFTFEPEARPSP